MIRRSRTPPPDLPLPLTPPAMPGWLRKAAAGNATRNGAGRDPDSFTLGAALAALHPLAMSRDAPARLWRQRLAYAPALLANGLDGRAEEAGRLRDHWYLRQTGDDPGPAGRLLGAFYALGEAAALRAGDWPQRLPRLFGLPEGDAAMAAALEGAADLARDPALPPTAAAAEAARRVILLHPDARAMGLWIGDAVLALRLGWPLAVPLLGGGIARRDLAQAQEGAAWEVVSTRALTRAAVAAFDLHLDLGRRVLTMRHAASGLRSRDAQGFARRLESEDALAAHAGASASDRAARRFFERMAELGALRELTGRASFRLYGL